MKRIVLLGSTGSIGENTLRVVDALAPRLRVIALAVNRNYRRVLAQAARFGVRHVAVADIEGARQCAACAPRGVRVYAGPEGVAELAALAGADVVVCAMVGMAGLTPVLAAARRGTDIALATKEVLVAAGDIVTRACARNGARLLPVDSEHSAIFQCLAGVDGRGEAARRASPAVRRLVLTASGGPFACRPRLNLDRVTVDQALAHPTWNMGRKVSVDSATMMNKGLEIIEAHWLFGMPMDSIDVVLHPESIVHSMVEFADGSVLAQMSKPDMRFAIQYALTCPQRLTGGLPALDLTALDGLHFLPPDERRFPALRLARDAGRAGGSMPAVLNAANEVAVQRFLERGIGFSGIWNVVARVMDRHTVIARPSLDDLMEADAWARRAAYGLKLAARV